MSEEVGVARGEATIVYPFKPSVVERPESYLNVAPSECEPNGYSDTAQAMLGVRPVEKQPSPAAYVLAKAIELIEGDRNVQHGDRHECHGEIAKVWTWWLGVQVKPHDVAMMMSLLKTARIKTGAHNRDSYIDGCGYMAIAGEIADAKSTD